MTTHSSTLAWKIPWMEEPGRLAVHGVAKSWTRLSNFTFAFHFHALEKEMVQYSCLENPKDGVAWWAAICGVTQSWTRLKRRSSSSSRDMLKSTSMIKDLSISSFSPAMF